MVLGAFCKVKTIEVCHVWGQEHLAAVRLLGQGLRLGKHADQDEGISRHHTLKGAGNLSKVALIDRRHVIKHNRTRGLELDGSRADFTGNTHYAATRTSAVQVFHAFVARVIRTALKHLQNIARQEGLAHTRFCA